MEPSEYKQFEAKLDGLKRFTIGVYGVGHVLNDLCAACWFNYLLYFLTNVMQISSAGAGGVLLAGQVADGLSTPIVGTLSDRFDTRIGMRKPWYIFGTVLVPLSFFFVWEQCWVCNDDVSKIAWYAVFASLFNVGWASIQIAHMSMIPSLTPVQNRRDLLTGLRNAGTFASNVLVLLIALVLFAIISSPKTQFVVLSIIVLAIGLTLNAVFILVINEPKLSLLADTGSKVFQSSRSLKEDPDEMIEIKDEEKVTWRAWLKFPELYIIGVIYMSARLASNVATCLIPFFLTTVLDIGGVSSASEAAEKTPWELALIPLIMYISSTSVSVSLEKLGKRISRFRGIVSGAVCTSIGVLPMYFLTRPTAYAVIPLVIFVGAGFSQLLNFSMGLISDFVGFSGKSGAFVYGSVSFCDKLLSGIVLFCVTLGDLNNQAYVRDVMVILPLSAAAFAIVAGFFVRNMKSDYIELNKSQG